MHESGVGMSIDEMYDDWEGFFFGLGLRCYVR
jgi:hypothetical protein